MNVNELSETFARMASDFDVVAQAAKRLQKGASQFLESETLSIDGWLERERKILGAQLEIIESAIAKRK